MSLTVPSKIFFLERESSSYGLKPREITERPSCRAKFWTASEVAATAEPGTAIVVVDVWLSEPVRPGTKVS